MEKESGSVPEPTEEFIDEAFDGVAPDELDRGCVDVLPPPTADFGIPLDLGDISSRTSNEFEAIADEVTRNISALEFTPGQQSMAFDAASSEFEVGASFQANQQMFAPASLKTDNIIIEAPALPFYVNPVPTSFRSLKSLETLRSELEAAFAKCSIAFSPLEDGYGYSCSALSQLSLIEMDVKIYSDEGERLVEFRRMTGCRHGFGELSDLLASSLEVSFTSMEISFATSSPLEVSDAMLEDLGVPMPSLSRSVTHESDLLSTEGASRDAFIQGLRATAALAISTDSFTVDMFDKDGEGLVLAERVGELAKDDDEEVRTVAMAAVANIATLEHVCGKWLKDTIPTLVAGAQDEMPHVRREALRAIEAIASKDEKLAAKLVRAGVVPALELEANGGEDDQSPDDNMQSFAEAALQACRA